MSWPRLASSLVWLWLWLWLWLRLSIAWVAVGGLVAACATGGDGASALDSDASATGDDSGLGQDGTSHSDSGSSHDTGATMDVDTTMDGSAGMDSAMMGDAGATDSSAMDTGTVGCTFSGVLVTFDLSAQPGNEAMVAATSTGGGATAGALSRSSALTAAAGVGSINSSGWPTGGSADTTHYYTFTITPPSGCSLTLTTLAVDPLASATGPAMAAVGTSADNFASHVAFGTASASMVTIAGVSGATSAVEVRIFGYSATGTGGTLRVRTTLTLSGSLN